VSQSDTSPAPVPRSTDRMATQSLPMALMLRAAKHGVIIGVLMFSILPLGVMLCISFKNNGQFYSDMVYPTFPLHWENWGVAWNLTKDFMVNSLVVAIASTFLGVLGALSGAYFFARLRMPGANLLWALMVLLLMMPTISNLVPLFNLLKSMSLLNSLLGLTLVSCAAMQAFAIFILRGFIENIPGELFESAEIDGASHLQQFLNIVVPLSGPIVGTIAVTGFINAWNDYILPVVCLRDQELYTVTLGLTRLNGSYLKEWGPLMAGFTLSSVPVIILFVFSMRLFIRGMTEGAVKG